MQYSTIVVSTSEQGICTITLNRDECHNAFNRVLIQELTAAAREFELNAKGRMLLLCGNGRSFSAGADLRMMKDQRNSTADQNREEAEEMAQMFEVLNTVSAPLVGVVHGVALGGGFGLVAVCDYVIAQEGCQFGLSEVRLGLLPAVISPYVMAKIGKNWATALALSGRRISCAEALNLGLIHEIAPGSEAVADIVGRATEMFLAGAPLAQRKIKDLFSLVHSQPSGTARRRLTSDYIASARVGAEGQEGLSAFLEKREPAWKEGKKND